MAALTAAAAAARPPSEDVTCREYLVLAGLFPSDFRRLYPGRAYLVDLGTSAYAT